MGGVGAPNLGGSTSASEGGHPVDARDGRGSLAGGGSGDRKADLGGHGPGETPDFGFGGGSTSSVRTPSMPTVPKIDIRLPEELDQDEKE